jgi:serine/threonine-protein kinase
MNQKFWNSLAIVAAVVIPTFSIGAMEAFAQNSFGAIARSQSTEDKGYSWNYSNRAEAEDRAIFECERLSGSGDCEVLIWARNACMSISEGSNGAAGTGWSAYADEAEAAADRVCRNYGGRNCSTTRTICLPY